MIIRKNERFIYFGLLLESYNKRTITQLTNKCLDYEKQGDCNTCLIEESCYPYMPTSGYLGDYIKCTGLLRVVLKLN